METPDLSSTSEIKTQDTDKVFVLAETAKVDIEVALNKQFESTKGCRDVDTRIVSESPDGWLIHVTFSGPRWMVWGMPILKKQYSFYIDGKRQHERCGGLIVTGNGPISEEKDFGPIYSIWEVPDCVYLLAGLSYANLINFLRGEAALEVECTG